MDFLDTEPITAPSDKIDDESVKSIS